jgi:hypothetical protein
MATGVAVAGSTTWTDSVTVCAAPDSFLTWDSTLTVRFPDDGETFENADG